MKNNQNEENKRENQAPNLMWMWHSKCQTLINDLIIFW